MKNNEIKSINISKVKSFDVSSILNNKLNKYKYINNLKDYNSLNDYHLMITLVETMIEKAYQLYLLAEASKDPLFTQLMENELKEAAIFYDLIMKIYEENHNIVDPEKIKKLEEDFDEAIKNLEKLFN